MNGNSWSEIVDQSSKLDRFRFYITIYMFVCLYVCIYVYMRARANFHLYACDHMTIIFIHIMVRERTHRLYVLHNFDVCACMVHERVPSGT